MFDGAIWYVCENMGIGVKNDLPWRLKTEMAYFTKMTLSTNDENKKNIVIMGRRTWDSIPPKFKPLSNRINFVLSRSNLDLEKYGNTYGFKSFEDCMSKLQDEKFQNEYETIWVIGGSHIYKEAMNSKYYYRLYLTRVLKHFECDTFFPNLGNNLEEISVPDVPQGVQEENGIQFTYHVYQNINYKE
ncbi:dihydrofolate reductase isoform X2 [Aethina tumida]|uniref:dihydrofolate reductase isoform X2 n=1 Tax=Aethina tumida TaxID=116153 RepID=UPI00096B1E0E|nr:dihydrofolate reductase isoform X2 [Aethina tumida]